MHAYHHPNKIRPDHEWVDFFVQLRSDPSKTYGLEFVEGLWAEKLALIALIISIGIVVGSIIWVVEGGDLQTVYTVMGFVLTLAAGESSATCCRNGASAICHWTHPLNLL